MKRVQSRSSDLLVAEWDKLAPHREELIASGRDLSYHHILLPSLSELLADVLTKARRVLDAGCGTGTFLAQLAERNPVVEFTGIDPSGNSIDIARARRPKHENCGFRAVAIEDLVKDADPAGAYQAIIANMLLQNVANFRDVLLAAAALLAPGGVFVFAVPHPVFWPRYWQYDEEPWFRYDREFWIEAPYQTSLEPNSELRTTHVHRPLSAYLNGFRDAGLVVDRMCEPMPDGGLEGVYPIAWEFPRFLIGRCVRATL